MEEQKDSNIFQAIGLISGTPYKDEVMGWAIDLQGVQYRLFIPPKIFRGWLKELASNPTQSFFLRVYPKCFISPKQPPQIYFHVISWNKFNEKKEPLNLFSLKGFWQFIPQSRLPVLTVYRNKGCKDVMNKFKPTHLPVLMRRDDVQPYRYNKADEKPSKYFIQGEFTLIHAKQAFGYKSDLDKPSLEAPKYKRPVKEEKKIAKREQAIAPKPKVTNPKVKVRNN
jgi:hypothetical protein